MRLAGYVDMTFDDVMGAFAKSRIDGVLCSAMRVGLGMTDEPVIVHASEPELVADGSARVAVSWWFSDHSGSVHDGTASVQLLKIRSGREPITELLLTLTVDENRATETATAAHRLLDELTDHIAAVCA